MAAGSSWSPYARVYDPLKAGSIDGTDTEPHDRAVTRAIYANYKPNKIIKGDPEYTIFVSRLNKKTSDESLHEHFSQFGSVRNCTLVRDIITGASRGYAFIEYMKKSGAEEAYQRANKTIVDDREIFVDYECERVLPGWKPRRLGGGFGGQRESGQLRFGGRARPFKKPIGIKKLAPPKVGTSRL